MALVQGNCYGLADYGKSVIYWQVYRKLLVVLKFPDVTCKWCEVEALQKVTGTGVPNVNKNDANVPMTILQTKINLCYKAFRLYFIYAGTATEIRIAHWKVAV